MHMHSHKTYDNIEMYFPHASFFPGLVIAIELHVPCCSVCMAESICLIMLKSRDLTTHSCIVKDGSCFCACECAHSFVSGRGDRQMVAGGRPPLSPACTGPPSCGTPVNYNVIIITTDQMSPGSVSGRLFPSQRDLLSQRCLC